MHLLSSRLYRLSSCVYVSLQFMFGCLSFPLEYKKKKKQILLFIHNVQVSINNNE